MIVKKSVYDGVPMGTCLSNPTLFILRERLPNKSTCYRLASGSLSRHGLGSVRKRNPEGWAYCAERGGCCL